jgi:hypothetical protein
MPQDGLDALCTHIRAPHACLILIKSVKSSAACCGRVDKGTCSYQVLWNAFKRIAAGYSADEKAALFHGAAANAYRLAT